MSDELLARFREARESLSSVAHELETSQQQVLWVLAVAKHLGDQSYLTVAEVGEILREIEGINLSRQHISGILTKDRRAVSAKKASGLTRYQIMKPGEALIPKVEKLGVRFIDPELALSEIRNVEELFLTFAGVVKVCDAYAEGRTLDLLSEMKSATKIELLTANIQDQSKFRRDLAAYHRQYSVPIEVRVDASGRLHDRYIITPTSMMIVGTSLNGFTKKQSFVVAVGQDTRLAMDKVFTNVWSSAPQFV